MANYCKACPSCGKRSYRFFEGEYDIEERGQGRKISPDEGYCGKCGFRYSEHIEHGSEDEQAKQYRQKKREGE